MKKIEAIVEYKSPTKRRIFGVFFILLLVVGGGYFWLNPKKEDKNSYVTQTLQKGELTIIVSATGYLEPLESVEVGSEVSGTIKEVYVDDNDIVKKGQTLALIDKTKYESNVNQNRALLDATKATLESCDAKLKRLKSVIERNKALRLSTNNRLPSKSDWESDWADYLSAKADKANAKAQVQKASYALISAEYDLEKTVITSPIDGIILVRDIDSGQTVAASFQTPTLFTIAEDLTKMELRIDVDEADIGKVKVGQSAIFGVDTYLGEKFEAKVKKVLVNSEVVDGVVTYETVMDINNSKLLLRPGMSADADITTKKLENVFVVPRSALLFNPVEKKETKMFQIRAPKEKASIDAKPHVWVLKDNLPKKVYVKVLDMEGSISAVESKSLHVNDLIILAQEEKNDNS